MYILNRRYRTRTVLSVVFAASVASASFLFVRAECMYYATFGRFASYGRHVDVLRSDINLGIPGVRYGYKIVVSNFTMLPVRFEGIKFSGGDFDGGSGTVLHFAVQVWNEDAKLWTVGIDKYKNEGTDSRTHRRVTMISWPGSSLKTPSPFPLAPMFTKGQTVRIALYTVFAQPESPGQQAYYSSPIVIEDERITSQK